MAAVLTTRLTKGGDVLTIRFSPSRERVVKEVSADGRVQARNGFSGDRFTYRRQIRSSVKWGWAIESTSEEDLA